MKRRVYEILNRRDEDIQMRVKELRDARESREPPSLSALPDPLLSISAITHRSSEDHSEPLPCLISNQDAIAKTSDRDDILVMMEATIKANDFDIIVNLLQIPMEHTAMLGAMRSLRNDRETTIEGKSQTPGMTQTPDEPSNSVAESTPDAPDSLRVKSQFASTGLNALRRLSGKDDILPSWTITSQELDKKRQIGLGGASSIWEAQWRENIVAIKELRPTGEGKQSSPNCKDARRLFEQEVSFKLLEMNTIRGPGLLWMCVMLT